MKIYFATDHAGLELKNELLNFVRDEFGLEVVDCGAFELDMTDDYPDFVGAAAGALARDVATGLDSRAVIVGASGQAEAMTANRFKGVRCALYYGPAGKEQTDAGGKVLDMLASVRDHNDANALSLGARFLTVEEAKDAVRKWLAEPFSGEERHARRIKKIDSFTSTG